MYEKNNLVKLYKNYSSSNFNPNRGYINHINLIKIRWINKAINLLPDYNNFIDIGASNSEFSELLFKKGFVKGCAVEINPTNDLINFSMQKSNFILFQGLIQDFSEHKECGFFLLSEIFEHIPPVDIKGFIKKIEIWH